MARRFSRREALGFLGKGALATGALALGLNLEPVQAGWVVQERGAGVRAGTWHLPGPELRKGVLQGLTFDLQRGGLRPVQSGGGLYVSPVLRAHHWFQALGLLWDGDTPGFEARVSEDGRRWSAWTPLHGSDAPRTEEGGTTDLAFLPGRYLQFRTALPGAGLLGGVRAVYIDASGGPTLADVMGRQAERVAGAHTRGGFNLITRAEWGADESYRFRDGEEWWWPEYVPVEKAIIHHSVTPNWQDPVQAVRSIYHFHAVSRDWGDIGYNYLVDRFGNIYEGRFGGGHIVAGHAHQFNYGSVGVCAIGNYHPPAGGGYPSAALLSGLVTLLARRLRNYGVNPTGSSDFKPLPDRPGAPNLPNISSHRDVAPYTVSGGTSCPGDTLYQHLPSIRQRVRDAATPEYAARFLSQSLPDRVVRKSRVDVTVRVRNVGSATWRRGGSNPTRLLYQWYRIRDGGVVSGAQIPLPQDVGPGGTVDVAGQVNVPDQAGELGFRWEVVRANVARFAGQEGDATYDKRVDVIPFQVSPERLLMLVPRAEGPAGQDVVVDAGGTAWTAASNRSWITVSPSSSSGGRTTVIITVDPAGVLDGIRQGTVTFSNNGVTLGTVQVTAVIGDDPQQTYGPGISR